MEHTKHSVLGGVRLKGTREHIVKVSYQLFLTKNFKEVTVKEITKEAGVSQGAFFHYFNSKEQLFLEIVNQAFDSAVNAHFTKLNKQSLYQFYNDYIEWFLGDLYKQEIDEKHENVRENKPPVNQFTIVFDALKLFPDFQSKLIGSQQIELQSWKDVIHKARVENEIASPMSDEQIAKMFIYSSDGVGLRSIFTGSNHMVTRRELGDLWDSFYETLKTHV